MCDYCDCRSIAPISQLSVEHEEALTLIAGVRSTVAAAQPPDAQLTRLAELLARHTEREERGLFTELRTAGIGDGYVDGLLDEHRQLDDLAGAPPRRILELVDVLEQHIVREETDVFPAARQLLSAEQWERIADLDHMPMTKEHERDHHLHDHR
jgi:hemerythrin-like domain-containing protein